MIAAVRDVPLGEYVPTADQRVVLHGVPWSQYEALLAFRGQKSSPRISYLDGSMEIMSPSKHHERVKSYIGRLIEAYALERGIDLSPYGAWTLKEAPKEAGVEPDECYLVGDQNRDTPDFVIEVVWTSGGIDKLEAYRRLGVAEVWFWKNDVLTVYLLEGDQYAPKPSSRHLPGLDLALLMSVMDRPTAIQAVKAFRERLLGATSG
jgi:Uma2 family endonuclease